MPLGLQTVYDITVSDDHTYITEGGIINHNTTSSDIKKMFIPPPGKLIMQIDYSQVELRVLAYLAKEKTMMEWFTIGRDIHLASACLKWHKDYADILKIYENASHKEYEKWKIRRKQAKCYSGDTEILTIGGWQRLDSYDGISLIAQYHFDTGEIQFVGPEDYGSVISKINYVYSDRNIDLDITEDHQTLFITRAGIKIKTEFKNIVGKNGYMPCAGKVEYPTLSMTPDSFTRFVAMFTADGNINGLGKIRFGFTKDRKIIRCKFLLDQLGIFYTNPKPGKFYLPYKENLQIYRELSKFVGKDKKLGWYALHALNGKVYLEEAANWDSYINPKSKNKNVQFTTHVEQTADIMQAMGTLNGIRVVKHTHENKIILSYNLNLTIYSRVNLKNAKKYKVDKGKKMWGVTVPSRNLVIRKNGKVVLSGNTINFGIVYGQTAKKLANSLSSDDYPVSFAEAQEFLDNFNDQFPAIARYIRKQQRFAEKNGYVYNVFGRKRRLPNVVSENWGLQSEALRQAINAPIQGAASDFALFSSVLIREYISKGILPSTLEQIGTVHDSLIFYIDPIDIHKAIPILSKICRNPETKTWFDFEIKGIEMKVDFEIGKNWGELSRYNPQENYLTWVA